MKSFCILIGTIGLLCFSCKQNYKEIIFPQTDSISLRLLGDTSIIGMSLDMAKYHNLLLISDWYGDKLVWVFDVSKNEMVTKWIGNGRGPNEFISPIQMVLTDSILSIQGRPLLTSQKYRIDTSSLTLENIEPLIHVPANIDRLYPLNAEIYIASGRFNEGRYAILNHEGKIIQYFGDYPNFKSGEERVPNFWKFMHHQSTFTYSPSREKLASVTNYVLEIIDFSENQPKVEKQVLLYPYDYDFTNGEIRWKAKLQIGAVSVCSTDDYIFIVYNPNIDDGRDVEKSENPQIWIFDWDGNPVKKLLSDSWIRHMYVENDNKTVYCITYMPELTLATFTMSIIDP